MNEELQSLTQAALLFASVFVLMALGIAIVRRFRGGKTDDMAESSELLTKFRELHDEGGLSDDEFRTIKGKLASKLKTELKEISAPTGSKSAGN